MNIDDVIAERIAVVRARAETAKRRRLAFAAARRRGLAARHAQKLRNLSVRTTDGTATPADGAANDKGTACPFVEDSPSPASDSEENQ